MFPFWRSVIGSVLIAVGLAVVARDPALGQGRPPGRAGEGRVSCEDVIERVEHDTRVRSGENPNLTVIVRELGTTKVWAAHCLQAYGRRVPEVEESDEEDVIEKREEDEPEESAPEDVEEPGARERTGESTASSSDRRELHVDNPLKPGHEKERVERGRAEVPGE